MEEKCHRPFHWVGIIIRKAGILTRVKQINLLEGKDLQEQLEGHVKLVVRSAERERERVFQNGPSLEHKFKAVDQDRQSQFWFLYPRNNKTSWRILLYNS